MKIVEELSCKPFPLFNNIKGRILFSSGRMMFLLVEIPARGKVPEHSHPHEQMGVCLKGKAEFISGDESWQVSSGMFYWIEPGEKHSVTSLINEESLFLDVFSPPREDYIKKIATMGS